MTENKRYIIKGSDDFFLHIEDTTFTEDKHEGAIYDIYQVVCRLNEQDEQIKELETEILDLRAEIGRLNTRKEIEEPHWLKYESSKGYMSKSNQDIRFNGDE